MRLYSDRVRFIYTKFTVVNFEFIPLMLYHFVQSQELEEYKQNMYHYCPYLRLNSDVLVVELYVGAQTWV